MVLGPQPPADSPFGDRLIVCWTPTAPSDSQVRRMSIQDLERLAFLNVEKATLELRRRRNEQP